MTAKFIFKRRTFERSTTPNPYRPHGQNTFGAWQRVSEHDTIEDAQRALFNTGVGLWDRAVFFRGKRVVDSRGTILDMRLMSKPPTY